MADAIGHAEIWTCPVCAQVLDISGIGFYTKITCTQCGHESVVHDRFANYVLDGVVGVGGMSVVFHAQDRVLDRPIAIKVLNETYRNQPERIARFERECAMMAKVRHENVVDVYSAGWEGSQFYIAMELVAGHDLESVVSENGPLRQSEALEYARQVALGLQAARRAGLLHRDMKPGNVLITADGKAKVLDFGLAMTQRDEDSEEVIWATPYYVAPETIFREEEDVRTDIYSLGMTMRYLLTGVDSFSDEPIHHIPELAQFKEQLPSIRTVCPYLNDSLADLVDHMTQYNAKDRPLSYDSLLREMDDVAVDLSQEDALDTPEGQSRMKKRMLLAGMATLGAGVFAAALTALLTKPDPVQGYLDAGRELEWPAYDSARACLSAMSAADAGAKKLFADLSLMEDEPVMAAWAALHGMAMAVMQDDVVLAGELAEKFARACDRIDEQSAPTGSLPAALKAIRRILEQPGSSAAASCRSLSMPALQGLAFVIMKQDASLAREAFARAGAPYTVLSGELGTTDSSAPPDGETGNSSDVAAVPDQKGTAVPDAAGDVAVPGESAEDEGNQALRDLLPAALRRSNDVLAIRKAAQQQLIRYPDEASLEHRRLKVMMELCDVLAFAFQRIDDKLPGIIETQASPQQVRDRLRMLRVNREHFAEEVYAMLLLLRGDAAAAEQADPYRNESQAEGEPFHVLLTDWLKRYAP